jgi:hypothetical protein
MVHGAEKQKHLHEGPWGSRPGCSAHDALMHNILSCKVARPTCTHLATFDNDAKSCYDRIITVFVFMLCLSEARCLPIGLQDGGTDPPYGCEYSIKTKYGISSGTYFSIGNNLTHGPGQGSHMAPALWLIICCLLFDPMSKLCTGAEFCNPQCTTSHQRTGDGFAEPTSTASV